MSRPTPEAVSHGLALVLTAGIGVLLLTTERPPTQRAADPAAVIQVALEPEPEPSPPAPAPVPDPPKVAPRLIHREAPRTVAAPLMAAVSPTPTEFSTAADSPPTPAVQAPPPLKAPSGTIDAQYAATLRSNIDSRTTAPNSVEYRLLKPHGEVRVNFTLERSGMMVSCELARSSGSSLLDHHALEIVRSGRYPPFPGDAFQGESRHSFLITLEFHS